MISLQHKKQQNQPISRPSPPSRTLSSSASEKATDVVSFSPMARHDYLKRSNTHVTSLKYVGLRLKLTYYLIKRGWPLEKTPGVNGWKMPLFMVTLIHSAVTHIYIVSHSTFYLSVLNLLIGKINNG